MKPSIKLLGKKDLEKALKDLSDKKKMDFKGEVFATALDIQNRAKRNVRKSWDLGNLANSILINLIDGGMNAQIYPEAPYAIYVEEGTKPHFPPPSALEGWARRHGFESAWPICKVINERGLKAKPFLIPAWLAFKNKFLKKAEKIARG